MISALTGELKQYFKRTVIRLIQSYDARVPSGTALSSFFTY